MEASKVEAVQKMPTPKTKTDRCADIPGVDRIL